MSSRLNKVIVIFSITFSFLLYVQMAYLCYNFSDGTHLI